MAAPNPGAEVPLPQGPQPDDFLSPKVHVLPESPPRVYVLLESTSSQSPRPPRVHVLLESTPSYNPRPSRVRTRAIRLAAKNAKVP